MDAAARTKARMLTVAFAACLMAVAMLPNSANGMESAGAGGYGPLARIAATAEGANQAGRADAAATPDTAGPLARIAATGAATSAAAPDPTDASPATTLTGTDLLTALVEGWGALLDSVVIVPDGGPLDAVSPGHYAATRQDADAFAAALAEAQAVLDATDPAASPDEVTVACEQLSAAYETFADSLVYAMPDADDLANAIGTAAYLVQATCSSEDGSDVPAGAMWATPAALDQLRAALEEARNIAATGSEYDVAAAYSGLSSLVQEFLREELHI